jgi:putative redox protein
MVEMFLEYRGGLECTATHGPSGAALTTDAPVDNHGKGESFSPTDLTATSLGVCMMTVMGIAAEKRGVELKGTTVRVRKHMTTDPPRRIAKLEVEFDLPLPKDHPDRETLEYTARNCPVMLSLHPSIEKPVSFRWIG